MLRNKVKTKHHGFTMIEMLVVITIIVVLISLLLPALGQARILAQRTQCSANLRGIGQAIQIYAGNNQNQYPCNAYNANTGSELPFRGMINGVSAQTGQAQPAGLGLLYITGIIPVPTMFYCPQPGYYGPNIAAVGAYLPALVNTGAPINWTNIDYDYCYYYQLKQVPGNYTDVFTQQPTDAGESILAGDLTANWVGNWTWPGPLPASNHMVSGTGQPDGGNSLYNDGSVSWKNLKQMQIGYTWSGAMNFYQ